MMELFDKKFVHFMWDDELEGKECFLSNYVDTLRFYVEEGYKYNMHEVRKSDDVNEPFQTDDGSNFTFAYYDPNYEVKKAFNEGKVVQVKKIDSLADWIDCYGPPSWRKDCLYRIKPEEEKRYRPYESSAEMIADFIARFKAKCPQYAEPLIWLKTRDVDTNRFFVWGFHEASVDVGGFSVTHALLLSQYTYLDGSPVGMEVKE